MTVRHRQLIESTRRLVLTLNGESASLECLEEETKTQHAVAQRALIEAAALVARANESLLEAAK